MRLLDFVFVVAFFIYCYTFMISNSGLGTNKSLLMLSIFSTVDFMANLDWSIPIQGRSNECADF